MANARHWDSVYRRSTQTLPWEDHGLPPEIERWSRLIDAGSTLLDLGCGRGRHALRLAQQGFAVQGVDFSQAAISFARAAALEAPRELDANFAVADILVLRTTAKYDLAIDYSVFHHISPVDRQRYTETAAHVVKTGGFFGIVCYAPDEEHRGANKEPTRVGSLGNEMHYPYPDTITRLLSSAFILREYGASSLGRGGRHKGHHFLFQRR